MWPARCPAHDQMYHDTWAVGGRHAATSCIFGHCSHFASSAMEPPGYLRHWATPHNHFGVRRPGVAMPPPHASSAMAVTSPARPWTSLATTETDPCRTTILPSNIRTVFCIVSMLLVRVEGSEGWLTTQEKIQICLQT